MQEKTISVFVDESGDFGAYESHAPFYIVAMVFHNQNISISENIRIFDESIKYYGYQHHAVHTAPLIRRESIYEHELCENRKKLFCALFNFARKLDVKYTCALIQKSPELDLIEMTARLSRTLANFLSNNSDFLKSFDRVIVYYDNGQIELTRILTSVFNTLYTHVEFRKVRPVDYKLFQVADLICTLELLAMKADYGLWTKSEKEFFINTRDFKKNFLKPIRRKKFSNN